MKSNFSSPGFLWPLLALLCITIILFGLNKALRKTEWTRGKCQRILWETTTVILVWIVILTFLSYNGFFNDYSKLPPSPALALLIPLPFLVLFAFSKKGTRLLQEVPSYCLVFMQLFRIFVEVLIWFAFLANNLPVQRTFEGKNLDLFTGILALPAGYFLLRKKEYSSKILIVFNTVGILLLLNILIIAVLSMPTPIRFFMNEPSGKLLAQFPFILLPGVLVPIAYSLHIFSIRQVFMHGNTKKKY